MDKFNRLVEGGLQGFSSSAAKQIIRDSAEVTHYINERRGHFSYVQQLMNDKIIDDAMTRVKASGTFEYKEGEGFTYKRNMPSDQLLNERFVPEQSNKSDIVDDVETMRNEIARLRRENDILKNRLR